MDAAKTLFVHLVTVLERELANARAITMGMASTAQVIDDFKCTLATDLNCYFMEKVCVESPFFVLLQIRLYYNDSFSIRACFDEIFVSIMKMTITSLLYFLFMLSIINFHSVCTPLIYMH